jgi:ubiquinol-cytochrome c reductase cytochrome b subunit
MSLLTAFFVLVLAGSNDLIATRFHLSINDITWTLRVMLFVAPAIVFVVTRRVCLALQRKDRELVLHGHESARIVRFASGEYVEVHTPLNDDERWLRVQQEPVRPLEIAPAEDSRGVRRKGYRKDRIRRRVSEVFFETRVEPVTPAEYAAAHQQPHAEVEGAHDGRTAITAEREQEPAARA